MRVESPGGGDPSERVTFGWRSAGDLPSVSLRKPSQPERQNQNGPDKSPEKHEHLRMAGHGRRTTEEGMEEGVDSPGWALETRPGGPQLPTIRSGCYRNLSEPGVTSHGGRTGTDREVIWDQVSLSPPFSFSGGVLRLEPGYDAAVVAGSFSGRYASPERDIPRVHDGRERNTVPGLKP